MPKSCSSRIVFNVDKAHSMGSNSNRAVTRRRARFHLSGGLIEAEFDTTLPGVLPPRRDRDGNRLPSVPKFQLSASGSYEWPIADRANMYIAASFQHVGTATPKATDQENNPRTFVHGLPFGGHRRGIDDGRPETARLPTGQFPAPGSISTPACR